jgi:hypothetical protein
MRKRKPRQAQALLAPDPKTFPKLECSGSCYNATTEKKKCRCKCGGTFHGLGVKKDPCIVEKDLKYIRIELELRETF